MINKETQMLLDNKILNVVDLSPMEAGSINGGGLSEIMRKIVVAIGEIAGNMNNAIHEDPYWYRGFMH